MSRPMTFRGRKPTSSSSFSFSSSSSSTSSSSSSSSSTGEFISLLSVLYKLGFRFISKRRLLRKGAAIGGSGSDDLAVWSSPVQVTRGWSKLEGKARWPSRHAPEELDSSELGPIQLKGCPGAIFQR